MKRMHLRKPVQRRPGFTLVELLVVIGIIAVLIGMLLPALNGARRAAYGVTCSSNLRQMGIAMTMYNNEWKYYPGHSTVSGTAVWPTRLRKYMKGNQGVFRCPSQDPSRFDWLPNQTTPPVASNKDTGYGYNQGETLLLKLSGNFSYGYNDWGAGQDAPPSTFIIQDGAPNPGSKQRGLGGDVDTPGGKELKVSRVKKPAEMIAIADSTPDGNWDFAIDPRNPAEAPPPIHKGGANVLWCDGHVTWKLQKELVLFDPKKPLIKWQPGLIPAWDVIAMQWNNHNKADAASN